MPRSGVVTGFYSIGDGVPDESHAKEHETANPKGGFNPKSQKQTTEQARSRNPAWPIMPTVCSPSLNSCIVV